MAYVNCEVEPDVFSTRELIWEIHYRVKNDRLGKLDDETKTKLIEISEHVGAMDELDVPFTTDNLIDEMKFEWFRDNISKITLEQLESLIK